MRLQHSNLESITKTKKEDVNDWTGKTHASYAVFGIKGLLLTQKGHAGVSNLNLGELKKVLKKLEDRK